MHTITEWHQHLLDVLAMLACRVVIATTNQLHRCVPKDFEDIMRAVQRVDLLGVSLYWPFWTERFCAPALISVARDEPDLFPKRFARAIVYKLELLELWNIACGVDGLDVEGINLARIDDDDFNQIYFWECLNTRTPDAIELLIAPPTFSQILDAYEKQVEQEGRAANMQL
jgi:hypothetical protein